MDEKPIHECICENCGFRFQSSILMCRQCGSGKIHAVMIDDGPEWDVPAKDEKWTADQLARYLGLVYNNLFDDPEMRRKGAPPWVFGPEGALMSAIKEQLIHAFKIAKQQPAIVVPGIVRPGRIQ